MRSRLVPYIPFVERQHDAFRRTTRRRDRVRDRSDLLDEVVEQFDVAQKLLRRILGIREIGMERYEVDIVEAMIEHLVFPARVGRHVAVGRTASGEFDRRIDPTHDFRGLEGQPSVFLRGLRANLPRPIHLIAKAPKLHVMRLVIAVLTTQIGKLAARRMVAIFNEAPRLVGAASAEIDAEHRFNVDLAAPIDELIGPEGVGLGREPGEIEPARPLRRGTDAILPIIAREEVAAGIAHDRDAKLLCQIGDVLAKALRVGGRVAGFEYAGIDAAAHMLDEGAEQASVNVRNGEVAVDDEFCLRHDFPAFYPLMPAESMIASVTRRWKMRYAAATGSAARTAPARLRAYWTPKASWTWVIPTGTVMVV